MPPVEKGAASLIGAIILAPPSGADDAWRDRTRDPVIVSASGWNRGGKRAGGNELPLVMSDHSDWDALTATILETGAKESLDRPRPACGACALVRVAWDRGARRYAMRALAELLSDLAEAPHPAARHRRLVDYF